MSNSFLSISLLFLINFTFLSLSELFFSLSLSLLILKCDESLLLFHENPIRSRSTSPAIFVTILYLSLCDVNGAITRKRAQHLRSEVSTKSTTSSSSSTSTTTTEPPDREVDHDGDILRSHESIGHEISDLRIDGVKVNPDHSYTGSINIHNDEGIKNSDDQETSASNRHYKDPRITFDLAPQHQFNPFITNGGDPFANLPADPIGHRSRNQQSFQFQNPQQSHPVHHVQPPSGFFTSTTGKW